MRSQPASHSHCKWAVQGHIVTARLPLKIALIIRLVPTVENMLYWKKTRED